MIKNLTLTSLLVTIILSGYAQKPDSIRLKVNYAFTHIQDTLNREKVYSENMVLLLGRNASLYTSFDKITRTIEIQKALKTQSKEVVPGVGTITTNRPITKKSNQVDIFLYAQEKKLIRKETLFNDYLIEEPSPVISWKIASEKRTIGGLICQKATGYFKGRDYTAWFCPDLPFSAGPWKLNGLPGLIMEAYDSKKEVNFNFNGFEIVKRGQKTALTLQNSLYETALIELPSNGLMTTQKEFEKLRLAMQEDTAGFIKTAMAGKGIEVDVDPGFVSNTKPKKISINNPIELPDAN